VKIEEINSLNYSVSSGEGSMDIASFDSISLPQPSQRVAKKILKLTDDPFSNVFLLKKIILCDAAICLRLLKAANTFSFSKNKQITTINKAMMVLGWRNVRGILTSACILKKNTKDTDTAKFFLKNTIYRTHLITELSKFFKIDSEEELISTSLMLEIGRIAMFQNSPDKFKEVKEQVANKFSYKEAEQTTFGLTSTCLSHNLCERWNLAKPITASLELLSGANSNNPSKEKAFALDIISLSELLALEYSHKDLDRFGSAIKNIQSRLDINSHDISKIRKECAELTRESLKLIDRPTEK